MTEETYNGWKNYPTWAVNLWLENDEGLYRQALERTRDIIENPPRETPYWSDAEAALFNTADMLKDWVDELAELSAEDFGMVGDLVGYALGCVDWHEIAGAWVEQVAEVA